MRSLFFAVVAGGLAVGCTQDFGQYEPVDGAVGDGGASDAAKDAADAGDAGCKAPQGCFDTATACGSQCRNQRETCVNNCGQSNQCRQGCFNTEKGCRGTCASACTTCTTNGGCRAESQCGAAANN